MVLNASVGVVLEVVYYLLEGVFDYCVVGVKDHLFLHKELGAAIHIPKPFTTPIYD